MLSQNIDIFLFKLMFTQRDPWNPLNGEADAFLEVIAKYLICLEGGKIICIITSVARWLG